MDFYIELQQIDKQKENIVITILEGENIGSKLIFSEGKILYTNNKTYDWNNAINLIPKTNKSQVMTLTGEKIYIEYLRHDYNVVVCGAGHVSMSVIKMCKLLDLPVTVIDDRLIFANTAASSGADNVLCQHFDEALKNIEGDSSTFFIIVTRGHRYDEICLENIINKDNAYIGMIGSRLRVAKVLSFLEQKGISREKLNKVYTPIGLKIGAETPAEIAVSIMAQIIEVKNKEIGSSTYSNEILNAISGEKYSDVPKALVTIVSRKGSAPREIGTKMVVLKDGTMIGTIGGGCVEASLRQSAFSSIGNNKCQLVKIDMTGQEAEDDGMVCGGIIELFIEPIVN